MNTKPVRQQFIKDGLALVDEVPGLKGKPRPFQLQGISFLEWRQGRAMLADEPGLGKTLQALGWLWLHKADALPALVVCPASLKWNWKDEVKKWTPIKSTKTLSGRKSQPLKGNFALCVINYDVLWNWRKELRRFGFKTLVLDESHYIKNRGAQRTKGAVYVARKIPHAILMTGTPMLNRPADLFTSLRLLRPTWFASFWSFAQRYCNLRLTSHGWDSTGASNKKELHNLLQHRILIRRTKQEVLKELPAKTKTTVPFELTNQVEYRRAEDHFIQYLRDMGAGKGQLKAAKKAEFLVQLAALTRLTVEGKIERCVEWVENFLESGQKLVLFATHTAPLQLFENKFKKRCVKIDGSTSGDLRQTAVRRFQSDSSVHLFLGNVQAAGVGITLTASSNVAFLELPWTPALLDQAEDRVHRIGQREAVNVWYLLAKDSVDERQLVVLEKKRKVIDAVMSGKGLEEVHTFKAIREAYETKKD